MATTDREIIEQLVEALKDVIAVADRKTVEFDKARSAIAAAERYDAHRKRVNAITDAEIAAAERVAEPREPSDEAIKAFERAYSKTYVSRRAQVRESLRAAYRIDGIAAPLPPVESGWRTMESAPRNGTFFLGLLEYPNGMEMLQMRFDADGHLRDDAGDPAHSNVLRWHERPSLPPPEKEGGK